MTCKTPIGMAGALAVLLVGLGPMATPAHAANGASKSTLEKGKELAFNRKKGNCLACHAIAGGKEPGNVGPPLVNMKQRYPDEAKLRAQIWDATKNNPRTMMPPFGRNKILTEKEINEVTAFIYSL